ncbi:MAG TPA: CRISPR-associated protein Cas2 [Kurthia gibsonii]|nr:CRISPR-associated protein Cas2 [Kurthia gibsonii]
MATYIISYDLVKAGSKDYSNLYSAIKSLGKWAKVVESTWVVVSELSSVEIRDSLTLHMDAEDRIIVAKSGNVGAWKNVICSNEWLKTNL